MGTTTRHQKLLRKSSSLSSLFLSFLFGFLACAFTFTTGTSNLGRGLRTLEEEHDEPDESDESEVTKSISVWGICLFLIVVTIIFEKTKDRIEERASKDMLPIIESLFAEMTILGFLSVITFICTKIGFLEEISKHLFGTDGDEPQEMTELFEKVHYCLFAIMIFFVAQVIILVTLGTQSEEEWLALDRAVQDPPTLKKILEGHAGLEELDSKWGWTSYAHNKRMRHVQDQLFFYSLRKEFILERNLFPPFEPTKDPISSEFNYGRYLSMSMGETLAEVVEVSINTWVTVGVVTSIFFGIMMEIEENERIMGWIVVTCGWFMVLFNRFFEAKLLSIRDKFVATGLVKKVNDASTGRRRMSDEMVPLTQNEELPGWAFLDESRKERSAFEKYFFGHAPNRQHMLYWAQQEGTDFHLFLFRLTLLFNGIYVALMFVLFFPSEDFGEKNETEYISFVALGFFPVLLQMYGKRRFVATMTHISCIGCLRRPQVIANVIREEKTGRAVRAFVVLHKIHLATQSYKTKKNGIPSGKQVQNYKETLPSHVIEDISKTFDLFDDDHSGEISCGELKDLMESLGSAQDETQLSVMISLLDNNGDGTISKSEFIQWYSEQLQQNELNPHEMASSMFRMFDKDGSGSLTIAEFKESLDAFKVGLSIDDVTELVKELDEDRNGMIDEEEFAQLLRRHAHPPPELTTLSKMY